MTKLQEIRALQSLLPDRTKEIQSMQECCVDGEYTDHHCVTVFGTDTIGNYQVIRKFDVEIDVNMNWEYDLIYSLPEKEQKRYLDEHECINDNFYETYPYEENLYQYEIGEFMQIWYNVKDHTLYKFGRINKKDCHYCRLHGQWINLSQRMTKRKETFLDRFDCNMPSEGFYKDFSIHEDLVKAGYNGIDAFDWYYGCGEEESISRNSLFIRDKNIDELYTDILLNRTQEATHIRLYGLDNYIYLITQKDEAYQKELMAAMRVCQRHKYQITNIEAWRDMIFQLYEMEKDLHNPHYVCPTNLIQAHDKVSAQYRNALKRIEEKKRIKKLESEMQTAAQKLNEFIQHMQAFLNLCFSNNQLVIRPLRSPVEYIQEGIAMHHCVASYKERYNSLILSARNHQDERIATIEVSLHDYKIIQIRGKHNQATEYDQDIAVLLTKNMKQIRKANKKQQIINAALSA